MKSPSVLLKPLLSDLGSRCGVSTSRDLKTITVRSQHEGWSFLTITLSNFGADFEKSLDQGFVAHDQFCGFARTGGLPRFLGGFLELVFDRKSARLLDEPSIDAIRAVRQLTLMFAKMALPCSEKRKKAAIDGYVKCEQEVRQSDARLNGDDFGRFIRLSRTLWSGFFTRVDNSIYHSGVLPKHGPGATADRLRGNAKYDQKLWTSRLEAEFPHWENLIPSLSESALASLEDVTVLEPGSEIPVKVITVPKTLKAPRIIAEEPTAMQYMQQGLLELMMDEIRRDDNAANFIMFESQEPNQRLARQGSSDGSLATLDLSEASDRVSNQHVRAMLAPHRALRSAVDATRSRKAEVQGHGVIRLAKFASMGSALCFPMEALVFTTVIFCGIEKELSRRLTKEDLKFFYGRVRVYGDDIIVPVEYTRSVIRELETFGFRVNAKKSFWTGKFRESCGKDFYDGHDVSIVRLRQKFPRSRQDVEEMIRTVSFRNRMFAFGFVETVEMLDRLIGKLAPFPVVAPTSPLLGRHSYGPCQPEKHDARLHRPLVRGMAVQSVIPKSNLDSYGALMKWFLKRDPKEFRDRNHLQRAGRSEAVRIKLRWGSPF